MKRMMIFLVFFKVALVNAQKQSFDLFTFTPPKKWSRASKENSLIFSVTDNVKRTWAKIDIISSTTSRGSIDKDFESEWMELVMKRYGVVGQPLDIDSQNFQGYKLRTGLGKFVFNKDTASILLNTFSDGQRCASFILLSNTRIYGKILDEFVTSLSIAAANIPPAKNNAPVAPPASLAKDGFQFNQTSFEDGWTAIVKEDWVELHKDDIKVLLHYPRAEDKNYYSQYDEALRAFWNLLVAPRYTNLRQYQSPGYNYSSEPGYFGAGLLNDNATKKDVWVVLFSKGKSGWMEVIAPDRESFVKMFGINNPDRFFGDWDPLLRLAGMNRFAVGENDLTGKWSNDFVNSTYYYNVYTGLSAGASTYASRQNFVFRVNKTYNWDIAVGTGSTGSTMKVDQSKASGTWKMLNNWQIWFSEIERTPKTYNAYFSCVKGGRILWLQDSSYGNFTPYGKISQ